MTESLGERRAEDGGNAEGPEKSPDEVMQQLVQVCRPLVGGTLGCGANWIHFSVLVHFPDGREESFTITERRNHAKPKH